MGNGQSAPYNPENPRRIRDLKYAFKLTNEMAKDWNSKDEEDLEFVMNLTAPEYQALAFGAVGAGMALCMDDPKRGSKLAAKWKPWVSIVNQTEGPITVSMWNNWPQRVCEEAGVVIEANQTGKLSLPKEVNFNRDYPLNPILNERRIEVLFPNGFKNEFNCNCLNYGMSRGDLVVLPTCEFKVCDEIPVNPVQHDPDEEVAALEMMQFMAEANDPNCPPVSEEFLKILQEKLERWLKPALDEIKAS